MEGKNLSSFIDSLYSNPEMEITYKNKKYLISGYRESNEFVLRVDTIDVLSKQIFYIKNANVSKCVEAFEKEKIFDKKTIYEACDDITVLYG